MKLDPFWRQRQTKSRNRRRIFTILREHPSTFSELLSGTDLSRPVLSEYLNELADDRMIERRNRNGKRLYELTQRGKATELIRTRALASGFQAATALVQDSRMADAFVEMAKTAKENPEMFQVLIDWMLDFSLLMTSHPFLESKWLRILGNREQWQPFNEEIKKRMPPKVPLNTLEEFRAALDQISNTVTEMLWAEKQKEKT